MLLDILRSIIASTVRYVTKSDLRFGRAIEPRKCFSSFVLPRGVDGRSKKKRGWFPRKANVNLSEKFKFNDCVDQTVPLLDPACKIALIAGGSTGFGYSAAEHLLCKGAKIVVLADDDPKLGKLAVQKLCNDHGTTRAEYLQCDIRNKGQFEETLNEARQRHKEVQIIFNDLDKRRCPSKSFHSGTELKSNNNCAVTVIEAGLKIMNKTAGGCGGVIVSCASLFGFIDWPEDPFPIYCMKEPAIEVTIDFAEEYLTKTTGVRLIALCPTNKPFSQIGLPKLPELLPKNENAERPPCIPSSTRRIGIALCHAMAWAENGSVWVVEPSTCSSGIPWLVHFPKEKGEKINPQIYSNPPYPIKR